MEEQEEVNEGKRRRPRDTKEKGTKKETWSLADNLLQGERQARVSACLPAELGKMLDLCLLWAVPGSSADKESPCNAGGSMFDSCVGEIP